MAGVINKVWKMFGMNPVDDDQEEEYEKNYDEDLDNEQVEDERPSIFGGNKKNQKQIPSQTGSSIKMVIMQPTTYDQAEDICILLKEKKSIVLNLEYVNKDIARRIIDIISGAVIVLNGKMHKISNTIFVIAPSTYDITTEAAKEESKKITPVAWLKGND